MHPLHHADRIRLHDSLSCDHGNSLYHDRTSSGVFPSGDHDHDSCDPLMGRDLEHDLA
jgi:hypothetical protein